MHRYDNHNGNNYQHYGSKNDEVEDWIIFGMGAVYGMISMTLICCIFIVISYILGLTTNKLKSHFSKQQSLKTMV